MAGFVPRNTRRHAFLVVGYCLLLEHADGDPLSAHDPTQVRRGIREIRIVRRMCRRQRVIPATARSRAAPVEIAAPVHAGTASANRNRLLLGSGVVGSGWS